MMKEKIIEIILSQDKTSPGAFIILDVLGCDHIAQELLSLIEQEKKEQAKEIICRFANETEKAFGKNYLAERIAKEYGVEL